MKKDLKTPMLKWIASVRGVARQIKDLNGELPDEAVILILTDSLPDSYAPLVAQLDAMEESARTISHVITCLIGEERRQLGETDRESNAIALLAAGRRRRDRSEITCFGCGEKGHFRSECPKEKEREQKAKGTEEGP